jgi:hypothetical protein
MSKKFRPVFAASLVLLMFAQSVGAATPFKEAIQNQSLNQDGGYLPPEGGVPPSGDKKKLIKLLVPLGAIISVVVAIGAALCLWKKPWTKAARLPGDHVPFQFDSDFLLSNPSFI